MATSAKRSMKRLRCKGAEVWKGIEEVQSGRGCNKSDWFGPFPPLMLCGCILVQLLVRAWAGCDQPSLWVLSNTAVLDPLWLFIYTSCSTWTWSLHPLIAEYSWYILNVQLLLFRVLVCGFLLSPDLSVPPAQPSPIQPLSPPATSFQYITGKSDGPAMLNDPALQEERAGGHERDFFFTLNRELRSE